MKAQAYFDAIKLKLATSSFVNEVIDSIAIPPRARPFNHSHCLRQAGHEVWRMQL